MPAVSSGVPCARTPVGHASSPISLGAHTAKISSVQPHACRRRQEAGTAAACCEEQASPIAASSGRSSRCPLALPRPLAWPVAPAPNHPQLTLVAASADPAGPGRETRSAGPPRPPPRPAAAMPPGGAPDPWAQVVRVQGSDGGAAAGRGGRQRPHPPRPTAFRPAPAAGGPGWHRALRHARCGPPGQRRGHQEGEQGVAGAPAAARLPPAAARLPPAHARLPPRLPSTPQAYRSRARRLHPDKGGDPAAFAALQAAFEVVGDARRRAVYDAWAKELKFRCGLRAGWLAGCRVMAGTLPPVPPAPAAAARAKRMNSPRTGSVMNKPLASDIS